MEGGVAPPSLRRAGEGPGDGRGEEVGGAGEGDARRNGVCTPRFLANEGTAWKRVGSRSSEGGRALFEKAGLCASRRLVGGGEARRRTGKGFGERRRDT